MNVTIYHNPHCGKSRAALRLLLDNGVEPRVVEYLKKPPSAAELDRILKALGREPREVLRTQEEPYRELGLADPATSRKALLAAMAAHPILIERPIVVAGNKAVVGRPPEAVLSLLAGKASRNSRA